MPSARDRAVLVLELLAQNVQGLPMSAVGDRLGIPRTAAHRLLADLKEMGYVKQNTHTSHYLLTIKLAALGLSYLAAAGVTDAAQPLLDDLAESSHELVRLAVIEGDHLTWVAKAQGARTGLRYDPDAGLDVYLPATANGLAWLAAVGEERALELLSRQGLEKMSRMGPGAPQSLRETLERVAQTRQRGFAMVFDAYEQGTSAMAAVVHGPHGRNPIATVSIAGPSIRMTEERMASLAPQLLSCAQALSAASSQSPLFSGSN